MGQNQKRRMFRNVRQVAVLGEKLLSTTAGLSRIDMPNYVKQNVIHKARST